MLFKGKMFHERVDFYIIEGIIINIKMYLLKVNIFFLFTTNTLKE